MINVAIITRRLREGKTYEDFRKAWYHTTGFGVGQGANRMYTVINTFDPREIIVIGFTRADLAGLEDGLKIDVSFRLHHSLDEIVEPEIGRKFGILVSEDDFSASGDIAYKPPSVEGEETNLPLFFRDLERVAALYMKAAESRDMERADREQGKSL